MVDGEVSRSHPRVIVLLVRSSLAVFLAVITSLSCGVAASNAVPGCAMGPTFDGFDGPRGTPPNGATWSYQLGAGGLNGQKQAYTNSGRNASLDGNGNLTITALAEPLSAPGHGVFDYTSARLHTLGKLELCYGRLSARIKIPGGQGLRPAFWLLGTDCGSVGWPKCGEIDIIDVANTYAGAGLHGPGTRLASEAPFDVTADWHSYWMDWRPDSITIGIDDQMLVAWTPESLKPGKEWVFNKPMFVILNVGVGGHGGRPDASTQFPAVMLVDAMEYTPLA